MKCILCHQSTTQVVEQISSIDLQKVWSQNYKIDISRLVSKTEKIALMYCSSCHLGFYNPSLPGDNLFYDDLQKMDWYYTDERPEFILASEYIKQTDKILEIGSGYGKFTRFIKSKHYQGLEFNVKACQVAGANGINVINESIEQHSRNHSGEYDVVCAFQVLEHIEDPRLFIESSIQCLKKGGLLVFAVPNENSFIPLGFNALLNLPPHHMTRWTDLVFKQFEQLFPLQIVSVTYDTLPKQDMNYAATVIYQKIIKILHRKHKTLDTSFTGKLIYRVAWNFAKLYSKGLTDNRVLPHGYSLIGVFRKS